MPKKLHDKVNELLKNDSFYPEKSEKEREDLAWPIATNILKESSFNFKNYRLAQVAVQDLLKSNTIDEFVEKFGGYAALNPNLLTKIVFGQYILANATFQNKKLSGYPAFSKLVSYLNTQNRIVTPEEIKKYLNDRKTESEDNFKFDETANKETEIATSEPNGLNVNKQPGIDEGNILNNLPKGQNTPGFSGVTGIQDVIQYTSQSAARAPKTEAQIKASEGMFMSDNMDALRILSTNVSDRNALKNFEKNLIFSKNHIGTRFEAPVNNLMNLYAASLNLKAGDVREKNKIGAQIQAIINNQLLGSGVKPSVIFDQVNPRQLTDYLYSKPGTNYAFRYLEDVYFQDKAEMETEFKTARKAFADEYIKNHPDVIEAGKELPEQFYPDNLKKVAGPGSSIHKREWMEANKKSIMQELANQPTKDSSLNTTEGSAIKAPIGEPNKTGPTSFDAKPPNNPAPTTDSAPASSGTKTTESRIKKFNLFKHS
jgi:hypothetical protein